MQILYFIMILALLLILSLVLPLILQRRAITSVLKIFRQKNALDAENAVTREELGIRPRTFMERMVKMRDYRPDALQFLLNAKIVKENEDSKLYFSEEQLVSLYENSTSKILKFLLPARK